MPCEDSMITDVITVTPDMKVTDAISLLSDKSLRWAPVIDAQGKLVGTFSLHIILKNMLPVSVTMEDGLNKLGFAAGAAPNVARKLKKIRKKTVGEIMDTKMKTLYPTTHTWEAVRILTKYGSPLPVIEKDSGKLVGMMSEQSVIDEMTNFKE